LCERIPVVDGLKYMKSHEWVNPEGESVTVGITEHAAAELGDIVYAELPDVGDSVSHGQSFGTLESVKAASDVYSPVSGTVQSVNTELSDSPGKVNEDPFGNGWMMTVKMHDSSELEKLLDANVSLIFHTRIANASFLANSP
jgi:glycine cleavage system H protein